MLNRRVDLHAIDATRRHLLDGVDVGSSPLGTSALADSTSVRTHWLISTQTATHWRSAPSRLRGLPGVSGSLGGSQCLAHASRALLRTLGIAGEDRVAGVLA